MGHFSWTTGDTKESIRVNEIKNVYMLTPKEFGGENIKETAYEGYGEFNGIDAYSRLAMMNVDNKIRIKATKLRIEQRLLGISLAHGKYYIDKEGKKYSNSLKGLFEDVEYFDYYNDEINDKIKKNVWTLKPMTDLLGAIKYPLKFSFIENAKYEDISASEVCENQGVF